MSDAVRLPEPLLLRQHEFLGFLRSRLGSEDAARDALQAAYLKAIEKAQSIDDDESRIAWREPACRRRRARPVSPAELRQHQQEEEMTATMKHEHIGHSHAPAGPARPGKDPVCGMTVDLDHPKGGKLVHEGAEIGFCSPQVPRPVQG